MVLALQRTLLPVSAVTRFPWPAATLTPGSGHRQDEEKIKLKGEVHRLIAPRDQKHQSNFVEFRATKIVYRRYAGLFFCACVDANDNELAYLEALHFFVEVLDAFFGNVCELDLVFNFYKVCARERGFLRSPPRGGSRLTRPGRRSMPSWTRCSWRARSRRRASRSF